MNVFISGSSGLVGGYLKNYFRGAACPNSEELDLTNQNEVKKYFSKNQFDYVIHLAAYTGNLQDSASNRILFLEKNILMNTFITKYAFESGVKNFLGILSNTIYSDEINDYPIKESYLFDGKPHDDLLPYAFSKRALALQINSYKEKYGINYNYLIPCNLYGIISEKNKKRSHFINDLIFKIINAKKSNLSEINLFGDGTPSRQFMHGDDLAKIIHQYVNMNLNESFNVAPDWNHSIRELANIALEVTSSSNLKLNFDSSKPNGQMRKDLDNTIFKKNIDGYSFISIEEGMKEIYEFYN
jgi:GDP-L-fucose synthase